MIVAVIAGGIILFPSLAVLFRLLLGGTLRIGRSTADDAAVERHQTPAASASVGRVAIALAVVGLGFLTFANAGWAHAIGAAALLVCAGLAVRALISPDVLS